MSETVWERKEAVCKVRKERETLEKVVSLCNGELVCKKLGNLNREEEHCEAEVCIQRNTLELSLTDLTSSIQSERSSGN